MCCAVCWNDGRGAALFASTQRTETCVEDHGHSLLYMDRKLTGQDIEQDSFKVKAALRNAAVARLTTFRVRRFRMFASALLIGGT
jgi:hypothetical protein